MLLHNGIVNGNNECTNGVPWILDTFGQCVETPVQYFGFIIGFISFLLWLLPIIPQVYKSYKRGHCDDALSIYFLLFWFFGDSLNLSGAILSKQLPIQIYTGIYWIIQDLIILGQYFYYKVQRGWRLRLLRDLGPPTLSCFLLCFALTSVDLQKQDVVHRFRRHTLEAETSSDGSIPFSDRNKETIGLIFGSLSAFCYLSGRLPQLYKNYERKSTEGVSLLMFLIIIGGNLTYGLSVVLAGNTWTFLLHHLPWILGSFSVCFLDVIILLQYFKYKKRPNLVDIDVEENENDNLQTDHSKTSDSDTEVLTNFDQLTINDDSTT